MMTDNRLSVSMIRMLALCHSSLRTPWMEVTFNALYISSDRVQ